MLGFIPIQLDWLTAPFRPTMILSLKLAQM
jgi:hypothetical protein